MEMKALLKEWRIWVLILALAVSTVALGPHYAEDEQGEVTIATNLNQGLDLIGGTRVLLNVEGENISEENVNTVANILEARVSAFGLTQTDIRTVRLGDEFRIQVSVADTNQTRLRELISQEGSFESRIELKVRDEREFELFETHTLRFTGSQLEVDGDRTYSPGDDFELGGTTFYYQNNSDGAANLEVLMYDGEDVQEVLRSGRNVGVTEEDNRFSFQFPVVISQEAAENVRRVAGNYETRLGANDQNYLAQEGEFSMLNLYVDGQRQSSLRMAAVFRSQLIQQPSITGSGETAAEAREEMERLQSILESGSLPFPVEIVSISTITASLGQQFLSASFLSIFAALVAVGVLIFLRYGDPKVSIPIVMTGSAEVYILLGAWFSTMATLDLSSIAGIIAAVGTGVDDQIIITDESGREKIRSWTKRMKRAFFVIFTSAASTIGAMMPIVSPETSTLAVGAAGVGLIGYTFYGRKNPHYLAIGGFAIAVSAIAWSLNPSGFALQAVQGFAVTTILGIMVGITITRPAYAKVLEHIKED